MATTINSCDQTITQYNIQTGGASNLLNNVAPSSTSGVPVISQGASSQPVFGTAVVAGGGTGQVTLTNHGVLIGQGTSAVAATAAGSSGQVLQSGGASADPTYSTATYPSTAGTSGNILTSNGTNFVSSAAPASSPWVLIQTQTASNSASLSFTTGISNTYTNYVFVLSNVVPVTDATRLQMQVSVNGGSTYISTNYITGVNSAAYNSGAFSNQSSTSVMILTANITNTSPGLNATFWLSNITTANPPAAYWQTMSWTASSIVRMDIGAGYNTTTSGVNAFQWSFASGNISTGNFSLYGIKTS